MILYEFNRFLNLLYKPKTKLTPFPSLELSNQKSTSKITSNLRNQIKKYNSRERVDTFSYSEPMEINTDKYLERDQSYLNIINNHIIKLKMQNMIDLKKNNETFYYWYIKFKCMNNCLTYFYE